MGGESKVFKSLYITFYVELWKHAFFYKKNEPLLFLFYVLRGENKTGKSSDMYNLPKL
jgi:hypothetical protein